MKTPKQNTRISNFSSGGKPKYSYIKYAVFFIVLLALTGGGFLIIKKHKTVSSGSISVPTAYASEIPDWWNLKYFGHSACSSDLCKPDADIDGDGLNNLQEFYYHSDPLNPHTINDKLNDGELVAQGFDPSKPGRVTFEAAASQDSILGESLLFDQDIKKMVAESQDLSKVSLPVPSDSELKITTADDRDSAKKYFDQVSTATSRYFSVSQLSNTQDVLKNGLEGTDELKSRSIALSNDLRSITVPIRFLNFHKDSIAFYKLLGEVAVGPDVSIAKSSEWYDKAQAFLVVQQKLAADKDLLSREFSK